MATQRKMTGGAVPEESMMRETDGSKEWEGDDYDGTALFYFPAPVDLSNFQVIYLTISQLR